MKDRTDVISEAVDLITAFFIAREVERHGCNEIAETLSPVDRITDKVGIVLALFPRYLTGS